MPRRPSIPIAQAARLRRCSVKLRIPPGGLGLGMGELMAFLRMRLGDDGFDLIPAAWGWGTDAMAVVFDDPTAAPEIVEWVDQRWPQG